MEEPHKVIFVPLHEIPASVLYSFVGQCDELCHSTLQGEFESENTTEIPSQTELDEQQTEGQNQRDVESKDNHYAPRRNFQNQRGGRGGEGGRRGYPNGRVGRGSSRGGGGYQNGRNQYYDQPGNYYPRNYHYNNRGGVAGAVAAAAAVMGTSTIIIVQELKPAMHQLIHDLI